MIAIFSQRFAIALFLVALLLQVCAAQPPTQRPQEGVLLLKHGTTLSGFITPAGDRYLVLLGESGEARVPRADVVALVGNLQDAYEFKRSRLDDSLAARIDLAQWCLQQGMPARAADQLLATERLFGRNSQVDTIHQRLLAGTKKPTSPDEPIEQATTIAKVSFEQQLDKLPSHTIDAFNTTVQPLLLNRCASGGCHNMRGTSEYVLFRPFVGQATTRRLTERNLQATFPYIDRTEPLESLLLSKATEPHGGAPAAAIEAREQKQLDILRDWISSLGSEPRPFAPTTIAPANELLYQSAANAGETSVDSSTAFPKENAVEPIGDPFDPARFNQRHHGRTD